jgi:hypothetical protein
MDVLNIDENGRWKGKMCGAMQKSSTGWQVGAVDDAVVEVEEGFSPALVSFRGKPPHRLLAG